MAEIVNFITPPDFGEILSFRGMHVLGTVRYPEGRAQLTAQYIAICLLFGPRPVWAVWHAKTGKFTRFFGGKDEIAKAYPNLTWRRRMSRWDLAAVDDLTPAQRLRYLAERYKADMPKSRELEVA